MRRRQEGIQREDAHEDAGCDLTADNEDAPIDAVGERAAVQAEDDQGDQLHQADETHRDEGVGELGDLEGDGDVGDHGAERRDQASDEEPPECRLSAQGSEIDPHAPGSLAHGCG